MHSHPFFKSRHYKIYGHIVSKHHVIMLVAMAQSCGEHQMQPPIIINTSLWLKSQWSQHMNLQCSQMKCWST